LENLVRRQYIISGIILLTAMVFVAKLFRLQVLSSAYVQYATNNVLRKVVQYPARGLIYSRNGKLLVYNKAAYDLLVTPRELGSFDTLSLCNMLNISVDYLASEIKAAKKYSYYKPSIIVTQISSEDYAYFQEQLYKYPGFYVQPRTLREYPRSIAAHILGYISEASQELINKDNYYNPGDYTGATGIEKKYERYLRGEKGVKYFLVDVHSRQKGSYENGKRDVPAIVGENIITTIDMGLQEYAESLMQNKKGSIVAIEPSTGEILAMVSAPYYDPNMLVGRSRGVNYARLSTDSLKPLFNRALMAEYPPGSTFKIANSLIGLQEGAINNYTSFSCSGPASYPIRCTHDHVSPLSIQSAIRESCNPFFWNNFRLIIGNYSTTAEGYNTWRNHVLSFGFGHKLGTDLLSEMDGNVPLESFYNNIYGRRHWNAMTIRSMAIGQGELLVTPLHLANFAAVVANRGYYIVPHVVRSVQGYNSEKETLGFAKKTSSVKPEYFEVVINGMQDVVEKTSLRYTTRVQGIEVCGKTGTVQNPHGSDHSVFIAFAPKDNPKIALSVYVENGGWGSRYAAPIASLVIEKYINGSIANSRKWLEKKMLDANLLDTIQPE